MDTVDIIIPSANLNERIHDITMECVGNIKASEDYEKYKPRIIIVETGGCYFQGCSDVLIYSDNIGTYAKNVNKGLRESNADYMIVMSNDVFVNDKFIKPMLECFDEPRCGIATVLSSEFKEEPEDVIEEGYWGGCWMMSRECFEDVGYLDERFVNSFEDADYWVRTELAGYKLYLNRSCLVHHIGRATVRHDKSHRKNFSKNRELFQEKHKDSISKLYNQLK